MGQWLAAMKEGDSGDLDSSLISVDNLPKILGNPWIPT